jgi:hypothetical protein
MAMIEELVGIRRLRDAPEDAPIPPTPLSTTPSKLHIPKKKNDENKYKEFVRRKKFYVLGETTGSNGGAEVNEEAGAEDTEGTLLEGGTKLNFD